MKMNTFNVSKIVITLYFISSSVCDFLLFLLNSFATLLVLYLEFGLDSSRFNLNYRIP